MAWEQADPDPDPKEMRIAETVDREVSERLVEAYSSKLAYFPFVRVGNHKEKEVGDACAGRVQEKGDLSISIGAYYPCSPPMDRYARFQIRVGQKGKDSAQRNNQEWGHIFSEKAHERCMTGG